MKKYNLIVVGGGVAGVAAAVTAGRKGLHTLLIEKAGCLGGAISNNLVYPFMKYSMYEGRKLLSDGIFTEMRKRKEAYADTSWECYKFVFDDMVAEAGVEVLFHATVFQATTEERKVHKIQVATVSGTLELEAEMFVDATGDGELIFMTGCEFQLGRESDNLCQPMTTCFRVGNVDIEQFQQERNDLQEKYEQCRLENRIKNPRENILAFLGLGNGILHFNTTRIIKHDPTDVFAVSAAEIESRKQIQEIMNFLKSNSRAFDKSTIISIANQIGVRESRKLKGVHILTAEELKRGVHFEDTIALGNYNIDIHNPAGTGTEIYRFKPDEYYCIPYRSLLPKEYDNLMVAGRCLSATHEAHSAVRIIPICACMGEAAGMACWLAHKEKTGLHEVSFTQLRKQLKENGAVV